MQQMQLSMGRTLKMPENVSLLQNSEMGRGRGQKPINLNGQRLGNLFVIGLAGMIRVGARNTNRTFWLCSCDCGNFIVTPAQGLRSGRVKGCGCTLNHHYPDTTTHGMRHTPEYNVYCHAKARCQRPTIKHFDRYGGRGIEFRFNSFEEFYAEMGDRPSTSHSIDRIDNNGHYEKGNVRWATQKEQMNNTRVNRLIEYNGVTQTATQWAEEKQLKASVVNARSRAGWCVDCTLHNAPTIGCEHYV